MRKPQEGGWGMMIVYTIGAPDGEHIAYGDEAFDQVVDQLQTKFPDKELAITGKLASDSTIRRIQKLNFVGQKAKGDVA
jgi:hypothetical protein